MLIEFSVTNFLSIKDKATLSMVASKDKSLEKNLIYSNDKPGNILKTAVIYGANGSGKTNLLNAFSFFSFFISTSHEMQSGKKIAVEPFKLESDFANKPSSFDIIFKVNNIKYSYGFSATKEKVIDEYLYYYPKGRQSIIFERSDTNKYKFTSDIERQTQIKDKFHSDNKLFISTLSLWEYEKAKTPFMWLDNNLSILMYNTNLEKLTIKLMKENESINLRVKEILKSLIGGIEDIVFNEIEFNSDDNPYLKLFNDEAKAKILTNNDPVFINVNTLHKMNDSDDLVSFDLSDESEGTQKLFSILGYLLEILDKGLVLIVDELDVSFHTYLTKYLIELFTNPNINKNNAQLIFTTHDTNLLDSDLFRRDQIWFTEKQDKNNTVLYSLSSLGIRKDLALEKGYLNGKYGAIPNINSINIDW